MTWTLDVENVAGIREGSATLEPGVNAVRAANWQGKSSFVRAIEVAMGTAAPLTEGVDAGRVELDADGDAYRVDLERRGGRVDRAGTPYLASEYDRACADLYAFLDDDNEVRRAVRRGENLAEPLTRPLDLENVDERIADLAARRREVEAELQRVEEARRDLPAARKRATALEERRDRLRAERDELAGEDGDGGDDDREALSRKRAERSRVEDRIDRLAAAVERAGSKLAERRAERADLAVPDEDVAAELAGVRDDLRSLERDAELLQSVYAANRRVLDEGRLELVADVEHGLAGDAVTCWLCGGAADAETFESNLASLGERVADLEAAADERRERVADLEERREAARRARRRRSDLDDRIADLEATVADRRESLADLREREADLADEVEALADSVEETDGRLTDVESELKYVERELSDAREELSTLEARADERDALAAEADDLAGDIADLRDRKAELQRRTREAFDDAIADVLDRFDTSFETARLTSEFDLVVARDGREASLDALSEGELELLGIVAALAGHRAFEVGDRVPVLLLDGLGGLADRNLHELVAYLRDRADYLVLTAYPEGESFDGNRIDPGEWTVVSNEDVAA